MAEEEMTTLIYYTDNTVPEPLNSRVREHLRTHGLPIVEESNVDGERSHLNIFRNILRGIDRADTQHVAMAEHDCIYHADHFKFVPPKDDTFYYNASHWWAGYDTKMYYRPYGKRAALSGLICNRLLLRDAVVKRIAFLEAGGVLQRGVKGACEFGIVDDYKSELFRTDVPYLDIRWGGNFSGNRKNKSCARTLPYWGTFDNAMGVVPTGKWYQEATINGVAMPTRRKTDTNAKRWEQFVLPLMPHKGTMVDLGCNAGFYLRAATDLGMRAIGVEREPEFLAHARYWELHDSKGVTIVEQDVRDFTLPMASVVLMANFHYWLTPEEMDLLVAKLRKTTVSCILIGRHRPMASHKSDCRLTYLRKAFDGWTQERVIDGKKHFSVKFSNPDLFERDTEELFHHQQLAKSRKFLPSYRKMIETGDNTDYIAYLQWRKFRGVRVLLKRHTRLIHSVKTGGFLEPLTVVGDKVVDGDHRLILAKTTGIDTMVCRNKV